MSCLGLRSFSFIDVFVLFFAGSLTPSNSNSSGLAGNGSGLNSGFQGGLGQGSLSSSGASGGMSSSGLNGMSGSSGNGAGGAGSGSNGSQAGIDALSQAYSGIQQYAGLSGLLSQGNYPFIHLQMLCVLVCCSPLCRTPCPPPPPPFPLLNLFTPS
jgi:hypothetical protein